MKIAIVGCGGISAAHLGCLKLLGEDHLVACVDNDPDKTGLVEEEFECESYLTVDEMLSEQRVDAAIICTPPNTHRDIAGTLLRAGVPVLCEKPLAHTTEDARALVDIASDTRTPAYVAYCHRFNPAVQLMRDYVRDGKLGDILYLRCAFTGYAQFILSTWRVEPEISGGGALMDNGSHAIDVFQYILGPVKETKGSFHFPAGVAGDDAATIMLTSENNAAGHIMLGWSHSKADCVIEVVGTEMSLSYDYVTSKDRVQAYKNGEQIDDIAMAGDHTVRFLEQYKAFRSAVAGNMTNLATFAEAMGVSRVVDDCYGKRYHLAGVR